MIFRQLPKASQVLILANIAMAASMALAAAPLWRAATLRETAVAVLVCCVLGHVQVRLTEEKGRMSLGFAGLLGVAMLWGPANAALMAAVQTITCGVWPWVSARARGQAAKPVNLSRLVFNVSNTVTSATLSGFVYLGTHGNTGVDSLVECVPAGLWATGYYFAVNSWNTAAIIAIISARPIYRVWRDDFLWTAPLFLISGCGVIGAVLIAQNQTMRWLSVLILSPLYAVHYSYRVYCDKLRRELRQIRELKELNESVIASLATAIDAKDRYTSKHLVRVQCYALAMSEHLGIPPMEHEAIRCASLLHDIGKLGVPENILAKPGKLTGEEYNRVKTHVSIGAEILKPVKFPWPVMEAVLGHHERWDGGGYPRGLKGREIPIGARVIALADAFDALTSDRPYRPAMSVDDASVYVRSLSGRHFDPVVVDALMAVLQSCRRRIEELGANEGGGEASRGAGEISEDVIAQIAKANSDFLMMYDVAQSFHTPLDVAATLDAVARKAAQLFPGASSAVWLETGDGALALESAHGPHAARLQGRRLPAGAGASGEVFRGLRPLRNVDAALDLGDGDDGTEPLPLRSALAAPLRCAGVTLGAVCVYSEQPDAFTDQQMRLLVMLADHCAGGVYNARRLHQTEEMALTDPLTGLPNARALHAWLTGRLENSFRTHSPFAVILTDLDNFKTVNDTMGHLAGDDALRVAARAMQACMRPQDLLTRYGGDEFVMVIETSEPENASAFCLRLAESVAAEALNANLPIGASAGFAMYPDDGLNARELLEKADRRMYQNKAARKGRQRPEYP